MASLKSVSKLVAIVFVVFSTAACDSQIQKFVEGAVPKKRNDGNQSSAPNGVKISPGRLEAASTDISAEANITPNRHVSSSADISIKMGMSKTRVTNQ